MTDTTAPRTAAGRDRVFTLDEIHDFAKALSTRDAERAGKSATVAGRALVAASRTVHAKDGTVITISDGDVLVAILAIEAEPPDSGDGAAGLWCADDSWDTRYFCVKPKGHPVTGPGLTDHDYQPKSMPQPCPCPLTFYNLDPKCDECGHPLHASSCPARLRSGSPAPEGGE